MHLLQILFFSGLSALAGLLFAWWTLLREHKQGLDQLECEMTSKIVARYQAYVELEGRVTRAIQQFDHCENEFAQKLAERSTAMVNLENALDSYQGKAIVQRVETAFTAMASSPVAAPAANLEEELAAFQEKLRWQQEQEQAESERHSKTIQQLTERIRSLEPLGQVLHEQGHELEQARADAEAERAEFDLRLAELEPLVDDLTLSRQRYEGLEHELSRSIQERDEEKRAWEELARGIEEHRAALAQELKQSRTEKEAAERRVEAGDARVRDLERRASELETELQRGREEALGHAQTEAAWEVRESEWVTKSADWRAQEQDGKTREQGLHELQQVLEQDLQGARADHAAARTRVAELEPYIERLAEAEVHQSELQGQLEAQARSESAGKQRESEWVAKTAESGAREVDGKRRERDLHELQWKLEQDLLSARADHAEARTRVTELEPYIERLAEAQVHHSELERQLEARARSESAWKQRESDWVAKAAESAAREVDGKRRERDLHEQQRTLEQELQSARADHAVARTRVTELEPLIERLAAAQVHLSELGIELEAHARSESAWKQRESEWAAKSADWRVRENEWTTREQDLHELQRLLEQDLEGARADHAIARTRVAELEPYIVRLAQEAAERAELETELDRMRAESERREQGWTVQTANRERRIDALELEALASRDAHHVEVGRLGQRIVQLEGLRDRLRSVRKQQRAQERALCEGRENLRKWTERAAAAESLVEDAARSLDAQGRQIRELGGALDAAHAQLASTRGEVSEAQGEIARQAAAVALRDSSMGAASSVLSELKPMLEFLEQHLRTTEARDRSPAK